MTLLSLHRIWLTIGLAAMVSFADASVVHAQAFWIGGYGPGLYASRLMDNGSMAPPVLVSEQANPSFFALHPSLDVLYAVTETARNDAKNPAKLVAYRFDRSAYLAGETPKLTPISSEKIGGDGPCHIAIDAEGKWGVVSNYGSGSVALFPLAANGELQPECFTVQHEGTGGDPARQTGPHAHCAVFDPTNRWVLVADLGIDRVLIYSINASTKRLEPGPHPALEMPPGSGPRHLAFHPNGQFLYIINELGMTMTAATWDAKAGRLEIIETISTLAEGKPVPGGSTADVVVHPSGRFVYGSNRGPNTLALFAIQPTSGSIRRIENFDTLGKTPRNFRIAPSGKLLLAENQDSDSVFAFRIDTATGLLKPTGHSIRVIKPACIQFLKKE